MAQIKVTGVEAKRVKNFAHFYAKGSKVYQRDGFVLVSIKDDTKPSTAKMLVERLVNKAGATSLEVA